MYALFFLILHEHTDLVKPLLLTCLFIFGYLQKQAEQK